MASAGADWTLTTAAISSLAPTAWAIYYGKDTTKTVHLTLAISAVVSVFWGLIGYSMVYGKPLSSGVIGTETFGTVDKMLNSTVPGTSFHDIVWELNFLLSMLALVAGAVSQYFTTYGFVALSVALSLLAYCPLAMWQWNPAGWMATYGVQDQAGAQVVHLLAGVIVLAVTSLLGKKQEASGASEKATLLSVVVAALGMAALNAGENTPSLSLLNTYLAVAGGVTTYGALEIAYPGALTLRGKPTIGGVAKGAVLGLVASSSGAGWVSPMFQVLAAVIVVTLVFFARALNAKVAALPETAVVHGLGGAIAVSVTALFADKAYGLTGIDGAFYYNAPQLAKACAGISTVILEAGVATIVLVKFLEAASKAVFQASIFAAEEEAAVLAKEEAKTESA